MDSRSVSLHRASSDTGHKRSVRGEAPEQPLRAPDAHLKQVLRDPHQDLHEEALPLFNCLPTDSTGAKCFALGGNMLYSGFPDGSVVCWAWGVEGEPEWRRWDHADGVKERITSPICALATESDGSFVSACSSGRISFQPGKAPRHHHAQELVLPFFRGCRVIDKTRMGTVALTDLMSTSKDVFGASFRVRWDGEDNLDEVAKDLALKSWLHYFTITALALTSHNKVFGGDDDRPLVIVGTSNGALLGIQFGLYKEGEAESPPEQVFAVSPYYQVDGLTSAVMEDATALKQLNIDGPPITCISLSCDERGILLLATGRLETGSGVSRGPELHHIDLKAHWRSHKKDSQVESLERSVIPCDPLESGFFRLPIAARSIVGSSKAAIAIIDGQLWCWSYRGQPHRMTLESTATCLTLSFDGQWAVTGHSDGAVNVWGPLALCTQSINGAGLWSPRHYPAVHSMPVQAVAFKKEMLFNNSEGWQLISAGNDREVHRLRIGSDQSYAAWVAEGELVPEDTPLADQIHSVCVSTDRQLCCVAVGNVVKIYFFPDMCIGGHFKQLHELKGHDGSILCLAMSPNIAGIQHLFTGSSDNTVRVWELNSKLLPMLKFSTPMKNDMLGPLMSSVTAVCVDRSTAKLAFLGLSDGSIEIWTWQDDTKAKLQSLEFHQQPVLSLSTNTSRRLVSGSADNTGVIWENCDAPGEATCDFKLQTVLRSHDGNVNSVFIGFKGRKLVSASTDTNVLFWDMEQLGEPRVFKGHHAAVLATCTSHDMQTVFSADQCGVVHEWDVISGTARKSFHAKFGQDMSLNHDLELEHMVEVKSINLIEPDVHKVHVPGVDSVERGKWLVVVTAGTVKVKRLDLAEQTVRKGHTHYVSCVAMSSDDGLVVSASWDGQLICWDAVDKTQLARFKGHLGPVFCCDISDDNSYILSGSADTTIIVWDRERVAQKKVLRGYHDEPVQSLKITPGVVGELFRFVTSSIDHKVNLFAMDAECDPKLLAFLRHDVGLSCVIGPKVVGRRVAMGASDGTIILWRPKIVKCDNAVSVRGSVVVIDEALAAVESDRQCLKYHGQRINSVSFSSDGQLLIASCADGYASAWWRGTTAEAMWKMTKTFTHTGNPAVNVARFNVQHTESDILLAILGCEDNAIYIWDYVSHVIERVLRGHTGAIYDLEVSSDGRLLISAAREHRMLRWNLVRGTADQQLIGHEDGVVVATVSHTTQKVISGGKDNKIIVWNTVGPSAGTPQLNLLLHSGNVSCLALSKNGKLLLSGSWDTTVCLTDLETPQVIRRFHGHCGAVQGCVIGGEGEEVLVSCCRTGSLIRWNLESGKADWSIALGGSARCLAFSTANLILIGCEKDCAIQLRDCQGNERLKQLECHKFLVTSLAFGFGGRLLCSADQGGMLVFWDAEHSNFLQMGAPFTCPHLKAGLASIDIVGESLLVSTNGGHVLMFSIDADIGILPGAAPQRLWKHHHAHVPCVRFLAPPGGSLKVVTASYDRRILIHPTEDGSALWFSWRSIMNAARRQNYVLFRELLQNQQEIIHEKVYPVGWTLLHALTEMGDLTAIQELFSMSGDEPLGFTTDANLQTPLHIGFDYMFSGILDYFLSAAASWPKHVVQFNTEEICALVPLGLKSMPGFLDSRMFVPLPAETELPPTETLLTAGFNPGGGSAEYFEAIGMGGSTVPALTSDEYATAGICIRNADDLLLMDESPEEHAHRAAGVRYGQLALYRFLRQDLWSGIMMIVVLADFLGTACAMLVDDIEAESNSVTLISLGALAFFCLDIFLRIIASELKFVNGPDRHMNIAELLITVICVVVEVAKSNFPASFGRLMRPCLRAARILRGYTKILGSYVTGARIKLGSGGTVPIVLRCAFLHGVMDHHKGILAQLVNCKEPDIFRSTTVRAILEFKWMQYGQKNHVVNFATFVLYLAMWSIYGALTYGPAELLPGDNLSFYQDGLGVINICFSMRYLAYEGAKLYRRGLLEYISSGWHILNVICSSCVTLIVVLELAHTSDDTTAARRLSGVVTPFVWMQSFNYLRGFRGTGALVRMMISTCLDIKYFSLIMIVMTVACTQSFFILQSEGIAPLDEPWEIGWQVYNTAFLGAQWSDYAGPLLARLVYTFMTLFQLVVLMNLLLAIMGDTFARVKSGATVEFYRNLAHLIYELEVLFPASHLRVAKHFPDYVLFSAREALTPDDTEEVGVEEVRHADVKTSIAQAQMDLKVVKRQTDRVAEAMNRPSGDGSLSLGSPRHQFHV